VVEESLEDDATIWCFFLSYHFVVDRESFLCHSILTYALDLWFSVTENLDLHNDEWGSNIEQYVTHFGAEIEFYVPVGRLNPFPSPFDAPATKLFSAAFQ